MPVPSSISQLSQTAGSNSPAGGESPTAADDYFRQYGAFLALLRDGKGYSAESDVASAATTDIGAANTFMVRVTGTTNITSLGANYSGPRYLRFSGALTLAHNASSLILPGGTNLTTSAGFSCVAVPVGNPASGWQIVSTTDGGGMVGEVKMHAGSSLPGGWLACNGAAISRTTYAALFAVIGTAYGVGDGSTTFNVPNLLDRMPIGAGNLYANGASGGSKDAIVVSHNHTLSGSTGGQSADHTHAVNDPGHAHGGSFLRADAGGGIGPGGGTIAYGSIPAATTNISLGGASQNHTHTLSGSTSTEGASGANANLPPYVGVRFIIKA